jgi:penicillin-binding protein 1A
MSGAWEGFAERMDRLAVRGPKKAVLDLAGEAATLGTAGALVVLWLAMPAFARLRQLAEGPGARRHLSRPLRAGGRPRGHPSRRQRQARGLPRPPRSRRRSPPRTGASSSIGASTRSARPGHDVERRGGGQVQGGSSITQQLAKNLFLSNERTLERKIKEAFLAVWLEFHLSKTRS